MDELGVFFCGFLAGAALAALVAGVSSTSYYRGKAVERGAAEYGRTTGEFEWIEVKPKKKEE